MKYLLNIGGNTGPSNRAEVVDAVKAFFLLYGEEPACMTVMPEALPALAIMWSEEAGAGNTASQMLADGQAVKLLGLYLTLGPTYTLSR